MYKLKIADLYINVLSDNTFNNFFNEYTIDNEDKVDITIENPKDIIDFHDKLASKLSTHNGFVIHGACIEYKNNAYLFIAPTHTGKTTHIKLWLKHLKECKVINGDKPIVRLINDECRIYGTPWNGKERYGSNISSKLKSIIILNRSDVDSITKVNKKDYINEIINQIYLPDNKNNLIETLQLIDSTFSSVDVYKLNCTMNDNAFLCAYKELVGEDYEIK